MGFEVLIRGTDLKPRGLLEDFTGIEVVPRHNAIGAYSLAISADTDKAPLLVEGNGLIVRRNGVRIMSGPIQSVDWTRAADSSGEGTLQVSGADDNTVLNEATCWPNPGNDLDHQTDGVYKVTGAAETVMRTLVNVNIGPGARAERQVAGLTLATDLGRGPTVTKQINQFDNLLTVLTDIANTAGLGFRIIQVGTGLQFQVYEPVDRSQTAKFSFGLGNLTDASYTKTPPTCTVALVVAGGTSSPRVIKTYSRPDLLVPGLRIEQFVDKTDVDTASVDLTAQMDQAADEALTQGARQASLSITPIDIPTLVYGVDYGLGDTASVEVRGEFITDVIREVTLSGDASTGDVVKPLIGGPDATDTTQPNSLLLQLMARLNKRLSRVETRVPK